MHFALQIGLAYRVTENNCMQNPHVEAIGWASCFKRQRKRKEIKGYKRIPM
jgi:hypothetical protein